MIGLWRAETSELQLKEETMKALFRINIGRGCYIAVFSNMVVIEYYDSEDQMIDGMRLI